MSNQLQIATFGGGCFWCTEAIFQKINGVTKVQSGYSGGDVENPSYEEVSTGNTGHAEVVQIEFDESIVTHDKLLEVLFKLHDPTTKNRQGNDVGPQYRSVIFYHNDAQKKQAENTKKKLENKKLYSNPIVTEILPFKNFYPAEDYHQNYYNDNQNQPYCTAIIDPKLKKLFKKFSKDLK